MTDTTATPSRSIIADASAAALLQEAEAASSASPASGDHQHQQQPAVSRSKTERRSDSSNPTPQQLQPTASSSSASSGGNTRNQLPRGPRSLFLRRSDHGFGFTLRHFIVYPPESYSMLAGDRHVHQGPGNTSRLDEPMDTIFVKHVREKSAAHAAGLATGDRLICVNGASVAGRSYAQVVQLIQQSGDFLHLLVVPREDDLLQLYFSETAHNPYTNQRPWEIRQRDFHADQSVNKARASPVTMLSTYHQASSPAHRSLPRPGSTSSRRSSEGSVLPQWRGCHSPFNGHAAAPLSLQPQRAGSVERECISDERRRESTASLPPNVGTTDSSPRLSIASSLDQNEADSVITRIKKSFEQKEEFLKRPNQPIWLPSSSSSVSSTSSTSSQNATLIPREFYAHPQKFQRPQWPPTQEQNGTEVVEETEPLSPRAQFLCGGPVTNVQAPSRGIASDTTSMRPLQTSSLRTQHVSVASQQPRQFVSTLARITENQPVQSANVVPMVPAEIQQMVSRRARQFESGRVEEDRTVLYRSELARLSAKKVVPDVAYRKQEFESKSRSLDTTGRPPRAPPRQQQQQQPPPQRQSTPPPKQQEEERVKRDILRPFLPFSLSGNCVIPVGGRYVPCDVDSGWLDDDETTETPRSDPPQAPPDPPALLVSEAPVPRSRSNSVESWTPPSKDKRLSSGPVASPPTAGTERPTRPTQLSLQNPLCPPSPPLASTAESVQAAPELPESAHTPALVPSGRSDVVTPVAGVLLRRPRHNSSETDAERAVRRASYLKATWSERMHVDSDLSEDDPLHSPNNTCSSPRGDEEEGTHNIHQLRAYFAERTQQQQTTTPAAPPPRPEGVLREGWLHCKLSLQDGKRAADRSWKQVWAVLRGTTLYLRKERRDATGHHHASPTPASSATSLQATTAGEESAVPLRGCLVDAAADYTKKKHVLRLHTPAGSQLLLQAEDPQDMAQWLQLLRPRSQEGSTDDLSSEPPTSPGPGSSSPPQAPKLSPQAAHKGIRKLTTSFRNRSPTGQSPVNKTRKPSQNEPLSSPKSKTWKGRVAKQLRRIQGASPSSPTTPHPEGATIGIPLEDCPMSQSVGSENVPFLVELCTTIVEERGLDIIGIYRVPGNTAAVSLLTESVNKGLDDINLQDPRWNDVNVISSLLKSFFRKLPDSLFTGELYPLFIASDKLEDPNVRFRRIRKLVRDLPEHHFETLRWLMAHLNKVVQHSTSNKMEARNLAIVFGPTLLRTSDDNMVAMVTDMPHQCRIVESLISHADWFFSEEEDTDDLVTPNPPSSLPNDSADAASDAANHSLLLNNIHKVEGYSSPSKEISAKDIVSSIISAANKKMQKAKTRRGIRLGSEDVSDSRDDEKVITTERSTKSQSCGHESTGDKTDSTPPASAGHETAHSGMSVASSILSSVLFSGNIVKNIHAPHAAVQPGSPQPSKPIKPADGISTHTYAGLSASTQERVRRFEMETKAMMSRDPTKYRGDIRDIDKQKIELDWQKAKQELESDILDEIADNPSEMRKKLPEVEARRNLQSKPPTGVASPSKPPLTTDRTALAVLTSLRAIRRGNSAENLAASSAEPTKSPFDAQKAAPNGTLKRLKTEKEQTAPVQSPSSLGSLRCGSLDSLHDAYFQEARADRPRSDASDDGHDLLASLTSTFDKKMRSLMKNDTEAETETEQQQQQPVGESESRPYRDPSLHRTKTRNSEPSPPPTQDTASKVRIREKDGNNTHSSRNSRKRDSGSPSPASLSKVEKEARNNSVITPSTSTSLLLARLKRKSAMHLQRGIKRRHTVGGTKDLARLGWLGEPPVSRPVLSEVEQQTELRAWLHRGRLRSSSPELSPRTAAAASLLLLAAAELSQAMSSKPKSPPPDLLTSLGIPLESHV